MDSLSAKARGAAADQKLGRDPNGVAVFGGEMHCFAQLSKNENSMRKILIGGGCLAQRRRGAERRRGFGPCRSVDM